MVSKFYNKIKDAVIERQVEDIYNEGINMYFPMDGGIEYPFNCDGFICTKTERGNLLRLIIEYKFNEVLTNKVARAKVLVQVVFYMKRFELAGQILPNVCMVGDKDECFVMHTNTLLKYLDEDVDWSVSPSNAAQRCPDLVLNISQDEEINPFIFNVDENFSFKDVSDKINELADNIKRYVRVTEHNLAKIFDYFCKNVLKGRAKMSGHDQVEVFMGVIGNHNDYYQHPMKKNVLVCKGREVTIDGDAFKSFFGYFDRNYTPQEKMRMDGIADRLIEDTDRRRRGDFWTPTVWVDYAHDMISKQLGEDWKEKYVVYDCCCGALNLTRDYRFSELYCSTLEQGELNIGEQYNPEATKFQFDFLNDYIPMPGEVVQMETKMPKGLMDALRQDKPMVFFLNPPYATGCNVGETSKAGTNDTLIRKQMIADNIGSGAENIQHQFMYRIMQLKQKFNLTNCYIALFSNPIYLTGGKQQKFLNVFCDNFCMLDGIMFQASEFANVSNRWGITFNIWKNGTTIDRNNFYHNLVEYKGEEIVKINEKNLYNANNLKKASDWVREPIKNIQMADERPCMSNAINLKESERSPLTNSLAIGYFHNNANSVQYNGTFVGMYSSPFASAHGVVTMKENFDRCTTLFAARKLIEGNWINDKDEYLAPNTEHPGWDEFVNDSLVYSLFNSSSNQSSLRNIEYKGRTWDIKNEFFFMDRDEIVELANECNLSYTFNDTRTSSDRYVASRLRTATLSPEAQAVLDKARELTRKTFKYRELFDSEHPEYQIMNWDCGWYQIKALAKEYAKDDFEAFRTLYKQLADKMRPMVYELGFLR